MSQVAAVVQVIALFILIAARHDEPCVMLVGLAPLALVAAEATWHLMDETKVEAT